LPYLNAYILNVTGNLEKTFEARAREWLTLLRMVPAIFMLLEIYY